uniref:MOSC domain-containing protein n=1 Tax=Oryza rufipogon TaxID=4529 RepID=A0A0E0R198_ORYRU
MEKAAGFLSSLLGGGEEVPPEPAATVRSILIYPIKSCRGISVPQAPITSTGFRWDRQWVVVNSKGRAYTQRVGGFLGGGAPPRRFLLGTPGMDPLKIPLSAEQAIINDVSVWEWSGSAYDEGAEAAEWFSSYFGNPSRLVRFKEGSEIRPTNPDYAQGYKIMFTDCFPFLMASQGSLDALNEVLKEPVPMNRFRPNILVDGCHPYSEDLWKTIKINKLTFQGVKLCNRCKVPTINQENGILGTEPTETLLTFRSDEVLRPSHKNKRQVYFGQNLVCKESLSAKGKGRIIKVSDPPWIRQAAAATVKSIVVYPIKSCRGISVPQAAITSTGLRWDRPWLVMNSAGRAFTQRVEPKLALIEV